MDLSLVIDGQSVSVPGIAALGVTVGFVAGMFGVGGGFLLTPLLTVVFGVPLTISVGSGLCQMVGTALASLLRHRKVGQGEIRVDILMLVGSLVGVEAGARLLTALSAAGNVTVLGHTGPMVNFVVEATYAVLLFAISMLFWRQGRHGLHALEYVRVGPLSRIRLGPTVDLPAVHLRNVSAILVAELGLALGLLSGLLGIGGGIALMPVLIYGFGFPMRQAAGTGILVLLATSTFGTFVHALRGNVNLPLSMVLLAGASISAQFGALATRNLPAHTLRRIFSVVVLAAMVAVLWDLRRRFTQ
ncbi:MAG: sulfite exporter TauE/SafE family protein [Myxococcota bacterium]